tara:strand:- start:459 stop:995 length:537 start_codon:yes stop_codon:yes gene_type:complete
MAFIGQGAWQKGSFTTLPTNVSGYTLSGIPSTSTKVRLTFHNLSSSGDGYFYFRVGNSSATLSSGYKAVSSYHYFSNTDSTGTAFTDRFALSSSNWDSQNWQWHGYLDAEKIRNDGTAEEWMLTSEVHEDNGTHWTDNRILHFGRCLVDIGNTDLDRLVLYVSSGNFDSGIVRLDYVE